MKHGHGSLVASCSGIGGITIATGSERGAGANIEASDRFDATSGLDAASGLVESALRF